MITSFCILAEPEKLMYPYIESIRSVARFSDRIIVLYAAADEDQKQYRPFEKESHDKLHLLKEEIKERCCLNIIPNKTWKLQRNQSYEEIQKIVQDGLDQTTDGWFLKFDADNVFRKNFSSQIRQLFNDETDKIIFRRVNVTNKELVGINTQSEDIYAINIDSLKRKNITYRIGDISDWCKVVTTGSCITKIIEDINLIPVNYDATFFTRERVVGFWRTTEEAYCAANKNRTNKLVHLTDEEVLENYKSYRRLKLGKLISNNFVHPDDIKDKIENLEKNQWGYNNFS